MIDLWGEKENYGGRKINCPIFIYIVGTGVIFLQPPIFTPQISRHGIIDMSLNCKNT